MGASTESSTRCELTKEDDEKRTNVTVALSPRKCYSGLASERNTGANCGREGDGNASKETVHTRHSWRPRCENECYRVRSRPRSTARALACQKSFTFRDTAKATCTTIVSCIFDGIKWKYHTSRSTSELLEVLP